MKEAEKLYKQYYQMWKISGKSKLKNDTIFIEYLAAKKNLQTICRQERNMKLQTEASDILP